MNSRTTLLISVLTLVPLAGCLGSDGFDFDPHDPVPETGNTVHIRMWVEDMVKADIYPGFKANLWAFCAEAADPNDMYSVNAIEHRQASGLVERTQPDGSAVVDEDAMSKCSVPGPQLRVKQGDKVIVDFTNKHFHPHTIHWHGQFVPWESDGVPGSTQDAVVPPPAGPGQFKYEFIAKRAGTLWYHCHVDTQFHVMQGLYGMIIVEPRDETYEPKDIDKEYSLVFSNLIREQVEFIPVRPGEVFDPHAKHKHGAACGASGFPGCQNPAVPQDADVFLINGVSAPNTFDREDTLMTIDPGERIRIRILNAGPFTTETVHLHGHDMHVTHKDGNPLGPASFWADTILIGPGERYDVIVEGREDAVGIWVMHTHITSRVANDNMYPGGMLTKLVYNEVLEEFGKQPFAGVELPGGLPPRFPVDIPDDAYLQREVQLADLNIITDTNVAWTFPIDEPCAVQELEVAVTGQSSNPVFDLLSEITVDLLDPTGAAVASGTIGGVGASFDRIVFQFNETSETMPVSGLMAGDYMLSVGGSAIDASAILEAFVDYYPNLEAADKAADTYGKPRCGEIPQSILDANGY